MRKGNSYFNLNRVWNRWNVHKGAREKNARWRAKVIKNSAMINGGCGSPAALASLILWGPLLKELKKYGRSRSGIQCSFLSRGPPEGTVWTTRLTATTERTHCRSFVCLNLLCCHCRLQPPPLIKWQGALN